MRIASPAAVILALHALALVACGDPAGPPKDDELTVEGTPVAMNRCVTGTRWIGYQVNDGSWHEGVPRAEGGVTIGVGSIGAVAWVETINPEVSFPGFHTTVVYGTGAELTELAGTFREQWCPGVTKSVQLSTTVAGLREFEQVIAYLPDTNVFRLWHDAPSITIPSRPAPAADLVAVRTDRSVSGLWPVDVLVRRNIDLRAPASIPPLDFAVAGTLPIVARNLNLAGATDGQRTITVALHTANGTRARLGGASIYEGRATVPQVDPDALAPTDLHEAQIGDGVFAPSTRSWWGRDVATAPRVAGPLMACAAMSVLTTSPPHRMRIRVPVQPAYDRYARADIGPELRRITVIRTKAAHGGGPEWDLTIPDFGATSGYVPGFGLDQPATSDVRVSAGDAFLPSELRPREGLVVSSAFRYGHGPASDCPAVPASESAP